MQEVLGLFAPIYQTVTPGFDTLALQEAQALQQALPECPAIKLSDDDAAGWALQHAGLVSRCQASG